MEGGSGLNWVLMVCELLPGMGSQGCMPDSSELARKGRAALPSRESGVPPAWILAAGTAVTLSSHVGAPGARSCPHQGQGMGGSWPLCLLPPLYPTALSLPSWLFCPCS